MRNWLIALLFAAPLLAQAADLPTYKLEMKDGKLIPMRIEVPSGQKFVLEIHNTGKIPVEFESLQLRKEKVLAPGATTTLVLRGLDPGEYDFFDDFHPDAPPAVLVAK